MVRAKIDQPIIDCEVVKEAPPAPPILPHERPEKVLGATYKIKPPTMHAALYVTINHIELPDGQVRPIEVFLNTKDVEHAQWMHAITRLLSAVFRSPLPFGFALQELKEVVDPKGSYFLHGFPYGGIVDHVARVIEQHCIDIGAIGRDPEDPERRRVLDAKKAEAESRGVKAQQCPKCGEAALIRMDNCLTCTACGDSKCG